MIIVEHFSFVTGNRCITVCSSSPASVDSDALDPMFVSLTQSVSRCCSAAKHFNTTMTATTTTTTTATAKTSTASAQMASDGVVAIGVKRGAKKRNCRMLATSPR